MQDGKGWKMPFIKFIEDKRWDPGGRGRQRESGDRDQKTFQAAARSILDHPDTYKAYLTLIKINGRDKAGYGRVLTGMIAALHWCAWFRAFGFVPADRSKLVANKKLARLASDATIMLRRLIEEEEKGWSPDTIEWWWMTTIERRKNGVQPLPYLSNSDIMNALQVVADYCSTCARTRKKRRPNFNVHSLLLHLNRELSPKVRCAKSDPTYEAIGLFVQATFNVDNWSMLRTKREIERLKRTMLRENRVHEEEERLQQEYERLKQESMLSPGT